MLRGSTADILLVNLPPARTRAGTGQRGQAPLPQDRGHRHDRLRLGKRRRPRPCVAVLGLPRQAFAMTSWSTVLDRASGLAGHRHGYTPVAASGFRPLAGTGRHDRPLRRDGKKALPHPLQGRQQHPSRPDSGRKRQPAKSWCEDPSRPTGQFPQKPFLPVELRAHWSPR